MSKSGKPVSHTHVFGGPLQITPKTTSGGEEPAELLQNIEREPKFVVLKKIRVVSQECCTFLLVVCGRIGQSPSRALKQCFGNFPAF